MCSFCCKEFDITMGLITALEELKLGATLTAVDSGITGRGADMRAVKGEYAATTASVADDGVV